MGIVLETVIKNQKLFYLTGGAKAFKFVPNEDKHTQSKLKILCSSQTLTFNLFMVLKTFSLDIAIPISSAIKTLPYHN